MTSTLDHCYHYGKMLFKQAAVSILKKGKVPKHIGFILDGNRRYARKLGTSTCVGHYAGFRQFEKILDVCIELGIVEITVYVFSIENFKRSQEEVDYLMQLYREIFTDFCIQFPIIVESDIQVQLMGDMDSLPKDLADLLRKVMEDTKHHRSGRLNVCISYTSRHEMTTSIQKNIQMVEDGDLDLNNISHKTIEEHLATSLPLDLLVRTSGETRLSDFLLFQVNHGCQIQFISCYWPEITLWQLLNVFLEYQMYHDYMIKGIY